METCSQEHSAQHSKLFCQLLNEPLHKIDLFNKILIYSNFDLLLVFVSNILNPPPKRKEKKSEYNQVLPYRLKQRITDRNAALIKSIKFQHSNSFTSYDISNHLDLIMEPMALSSVQCLFQFQIHCLPDFPVICKCHLNRNDGNHLQWSGRQEREK